MTIAFLFCVSIKISRGTFYASYMLGNRSNNALSQLVKPQRQTKDDRGLSTAIALSSD